MYKTGAVCAATGVPAAKLARWQDRKTLKPSRHDKTSTGSGDHRLFSRESVNKIAIAKTLTDLGIAATPANRAAALLVGLYEFGRTLLVVKPSGAEIVNAGFNDPLSDICGRPFQAAVIIDIGQIIATVDQALISTTKDSL
jgi:MerR HTH family regulatory protein